MTYFHHWKALFTTQRIYKPFAFTITLTHTEAGGPKIHLHLWVIYCERVKSPSCAVEIDFVKLISINRNVKVLIKKLHYIFIAEASKRNTLRTCLAILDPVAPFNNINSSHKPTYKYITLRPRKECRIASSN